MTPRSQLLIEYKLSEKEGMGITNGRKMSDVMDVPKLVFRLRASLGSQISLEFLSCCHFEKSSFERQYYWARSSGKFQDSHQLVIYIFQCFCSL